MTISVSWIVKGCALAFKIIEEVKISSPLELRLQLKPIIKIGLKNYEYIVSLGKQLDL